MPFLGVAITRTFGLFCQFGVIAGVYPSFGLALTPREKPIERIGERRIR